MKFNELANGHDKMRLASIWLFNLTKMRDDYDASNSNSGSSNSDRRITIPAARKMLGMLARNYSDADLAKIIDVLYGIAEEGFDLYQDIGRISDQEE